MKIKFESGIVLKNKHLENSLFPIQPNPVSYAFDMDTELKCNL